MSIATVLPLAAALAAAPVLVPDAPSPTATKKAPRRADRARASIPVEGMSCAKCAANITAALEPMDGVDRAAVDLERGRVDVVFAPKKVSIDDILATIRKLGYRPGTPKVEKG